MQLANDEIEITVYDDAGNIVTHEIAKCFTATEDQFDAMIDLINKGLTADEARRVIIK